jgi:hypothetical protein
LPCPECNRLKVEIGIRESAYFSAIDRFSDFSWTDNTSDTLTGIRTALLIAVDESRDAMASAALKLDRHRQEHLSE